MKIQSGYQILSRIKYTVTNTLTGCTNSNNATQANWGSSYNATISASSGYTLTGATVSITMGGTDITSTAYSNGTISIANVTGNLVIAITAVAEVSEYKITNLVTSCRNMNTAKTVNSGSSYTAEIHTPFGYQLLPANITVTMGGVDVTSSVLSGNIITIPNVTGNISITATGTSAGLAAGLYQNGTLVTSWAALVSAYPSAFATNNYIKASSQTSYFTSLSGDLVIDSSITTIDNYAFNNCLSLTNVYIPTSVTTINMRAFANMTALTEVVLTSSVTTIGVNAFIGTSNLSAIYINGDLSFSQLISNSVFSQAGQNANGLEIVIGQNVTSVGTTLLTNSYLTKVNIPQSLTSVRGPAFASLSSYTDVDMQGDNPVYELNGNCLIQKSDNVIVTSFSGYTIPTDNSITTIGQSAFADQNGGALLEIPNNIETIGNQAFQSNQFATTIKIGSGVTSIGTSAFSGNPTPDTVFTELYFYMDNVTITSGAFKVKTGRSVTIYCKSTNTGVINYDWSGDNITATINQTL